MESGSFGCLLRDDKACLLLESLDCLFFVFYYCMSLTLFWLLVMWFGGCSNQVRLSCNCKTLQPAALVSSLLTDGVV